MANPLLSARQATTLGKVNAELVGEGIAPARVTAIEPESGDVLVESRDYRAVITAQGAVERVGK